MESNQGRESGIFHREQLFWSFVHAMFVIGCWTSGSAIAGYIGGAWHSVKAVTASPIQVAEADTGDDLSPELKERIAKQTAWLKDHPMPQLDDSFDMRTTPKGKR